MKTIYIKLIFSIVFLSSILSAKDDYSINKKLNIKLEKNQNLKKVKKEYISTLYEDLKLKNFLDFEVFSNAIIGAKKINGAKKDIITIIDFSKSSLDKRFFVIDLKNKKILYSTYVMHGKNSGDEFTTSFSNMINSYQSSPGFFLTENSYYGAYGYSLKLKGLEKGINDNAKERAIVIHGSKYATPFLGAKSLSKSLGCPAIPLEISKNIINLIKDKTIIYAHTNDSFYLNNSYYL